MHTLPALQPVRRTHARYTPVAPGEVPDPAASRPPMTGRHRHHDPLWPSMVVFPAVAITATGHLWGLGNNARRRPLPGRRQAEQLVYQRGVQSKASHPNRRCDPAGGRGRPRLDPGRHIHAAATPGVSLVCKSPTDTDPHVPAIPRADGHSAGPAIASNNAPVMTRWSGIHYVESWRGGHP